MSLRKRIRSERSTVQEMAGPGHATDAFPGSDEKIEVLRMRNAAGVPLWHPNDRDDHSPRRGSKEFVA